MARAPSTPAEVVDRSPGELSRLVRNLLIDNKNFQSRDGKEAHAFIEHPRTSGFVSGPPKSSAEFILNKIEGVKELAMVMAWSNKDDFTGEFDTETEALAAVSEYKKTGSIPESLMLETIFDEQKAESASATPRI